MYAIESLRWKCLVGGILALVISAGSAFLYFFREPFSPASLAVVSGTVAEAAERQSPGDPPFMEMRLEGNPTLFRVPIDAYEMVPDRPALLADLGARPVVTLGVDAASLRNPRKPLTGTLEAAAFVSTLATPSREYVTAADWVEWYRKDHEAVINLMIWGLLGGCFLLFVRTRPTLLRLMAGEALEVARERQRAR